MLLQPLLQISIDNLRIFVWDLLSCDRAFVSVAMPGRPIIPPGSPPPLAPYSPGMKSGEALYVSGTLALDADGQLVGENDATAQTRQVLESIKSVVEAAGGTLADVTFNMIFLKDFADYPKMNAVYAEYFPQPSPARYCIRADLVKPEFLVEIASIAHISNG
nr:pyrimidine utilization protein C [Leptolyngbya sp. FACHB-36]